MRKRQEFSERRLRVAFSHIPGEGWSAGAYYLKNLFYALRALPIETRPEIILLVHESAASKEYTELIPLVDKVLHRPAVEGKKVLAELIHNFWGKIGFVSRKDIPICVLLKKHGVDLLFTLGTPPPGFSLPFLSWIPDFQHIHYPDFFSEQEFESRNDSYRRSAQFATRVILSSNSSLNDFCNFAAWAEEKAKVLPFVAQIPDFIYSDNPLGVCEKYNIPERFILLPNQFWKHKNHGVVIGALKKALKEIPNLMIVCTGNTNENRDLTYFGKLLGSISCAGVRERMVLLGLVPRQDLFRLMRQSIAVLQPSLFEGWNTTIEEVKSLGTNLLVSDIPVHREQNATGAVYFHPTDEQALATSLLNMYTGGCSGPDLKMEAVAKSSLAIRTEKYGEMFWRLLRIV